MIKFFCLLACASTAFSASVEGTWISQCQNIGGNEPFKATRPVDTFRSDGTAFLRVHAFEKPNCRGKEWDLEKIDCTYKVGAQVQGIESTAELDLICKMNGVDQYWYEIVEILPNTLRFGSHTGLTIEDRPTELGNVYYERLSGIERLLEGEE